MIKDLITIRHSILYNKYKSSYNTAVIDFSTHSFFLYIIFQLFNKKYQILLPFLIPLLTLMLNRTFIVFHDCVHNSYTPNKSLNYILATVTGVLIHASPNWILDHDTHHLTNGNLDNKMHYFFNETVNYTEKQYNKFSEIGKFWYRVYKHPIVFFILFPFVYFSILQRFMYITKKLYYGYKIRGSLGYIIINHAINNIGIFVLYYYLKKYELLNYYILSLWISNINEFIIFHNQHTFNPSYVVENNKWSMKDSGIIGSSFIQFPYYSKYFFMGVEYHHVHHMNSKIPGYHLQEYHEEVVKTSTIFDNVVKLSMVDCYNNLWLMCYSEDRKKYSTFSTFSTFKKG